MTNMPKSLKETSMPKVKGSEIYLNGCSEFRAEPGRQRSLVSDDALASLPHGVEHGLL